MPLTPIQQKILEQVHNQLGEHFNAHVISVMITDTVNTEEHYHAVNGGLAVAVGLSQLTADRLSVTGIPSSSLPPLAPPPEDPPFS